MGRRSINLTIVSAKDLKSSSVFGKGQFFAVAYVHPSEKRRTGVAAQGGCNPTWNEKLDVPVEESALQNGDAALIVEIFDRAMLGEKIVGVVRIPVSYIVKDSQDGANRLVAYQVQRPSGRVQGSLNVIAKVGGKTVETGSSSQVGQNQAVQPSGMGNGVYPPSRDHTRPGSSSMQEPVMAYPASNSVPQPQPYSSYPPQYPPPPASSSYYPPQYGSQPYPQQPYPAATYVPAVVPPQRPQRNRFGTGGVGLGAGLLGGALGGLLLGDLISDVSYDNGYDQGYDAGYDQNFDGGYDQGFDGGGWDGGF